MSLYNISLLVFFIAVGLFLLGFVANVASVVAGIAAFVCAVLLIVGDKR